MCLANGMASGGNWFRPYVVCERLLPVRFEFSVPGACRCASSKQLAAWVDAFLTSGPWANEPLANYLRSPGRYWAGPVLLPGRELVRICGPEPGMRYSEPLSRWEQRVEDLRASIVDPTALPPLIVHPWKPETEGTTGPPRGWLIADGAHRFEALKRRGSESFWALIWFEEEIDFENFMQQGE